MQGRGRKAAVGWSRTGGRGAARQQGERAREVGVIGFRLGYSPHDEGLRGKGVARRGWGRRITGAEGDHGIVGEGGRK